MALGCLRGSRAGLRLRLKRPVVLGIYSAPVIIGGISKYRLNPITLQVQLNPTRKKGCCDVAPAREGMVASAKYGQRDGSAA